MEPSNAGSAWNALGRSVVDTWMMRGAVVIAFLVGCGGAAPTVSQLPPTGAAVTANAQPKPGNAPPKLAPLDPIRSLVPAQDGDMVSWVIPGQARLDLGGVSIDTAPANAPEIPTTILDQQGDLVRVAVRLEHARFSVWTKRTQVMQIVQRDLRVTPDAYVPLGDMGARLRVGAHVQKIGKRDGQTKVRFIGELEIEGWVADDALGDRGPRFTGYAGRTPRGLTTTLVIPGSIVRAEAQWAGGEIAIVNRGYLLDVVKDVDENWMEVIYQDGLSEVHGYYQKYGPPGRTHRRGVIDPDTAPLPIVPNAKVASGTCLYARANGDAIGYLVGDRDVALDAASSGWWTLGIDTPYGPLQFAARGLTTAELAACAPVDTVPPTKLGVSVP